MSGYIAFIAPQLAHEVIPPATLKAAIFHAIVMR